jgi:hypothetical protein
MSQFKRSLPSSASAQTNGRYLLSLLLSSGHDTMRQQESFSFQFSSRKWSRLQTTFQKCIWNRYNSCPGDTHFLGSCIRCHERALLWTICSVSRHFNSFQEISQRQFKNYSTFDSQERFQEGPHHPSFSISSSIDIEIGGVRRREVGTEWKRQETCQSESRSDVKMMTD